MLCGRPEGPITIAAIVQRLGEPLYRRCESSGSESRSTGFRSQGFESSFHRRDCNRPGVVLVGSARRRCRRAGGCNTALWFVSGHARALGTGDGAARSRVGFFLQPGAAFAAGEVLVASLRCDLGLAAALSASALRPMRAITVEFTATANAARHPGLGVRT